MNATKQIIHATIGLAALVGTSCATLGHIVPQQQKYSSEEQVRAQLEAMTASGYFSTLDAYRNEKIDQEPDRYITENYNGARVALKHMPNGVYTLAAETWQEDMKEDMSSLIYALENMKDNGFSYNYNLDTDE